MKEIKKQSRQVIAVSLLEHMGDIIATEPVVRYLRAENPGAFILFFTGRAYKPLLAYHPAVDRVVTLFCLSEWIYFSRSRFFDRIFDLHFQDRQCPVCRTRLLKAPEQRKITVDNYYEGRSLLEAYCGTAGLPSLQGNPQLFIPSFISKKADRLGLPGNFIVIHGRSNEKDRDWDDQKWNSLAQQITGEFKICIVEIGSMPVIHNAGPDFYRNFCSRVDYLTAAGIIKRSILFIGVDSGPAHMANAAGIPGIILLGKYRIFTRYQPYSGSYSDGSRADLIYSGTTAADIPEERVLEVVRRRLGALNRQYA